MLGIQLFVQLCCCQLGPLPIVFGTQPRSQASILLTLATCTDTLTHAWSLIHGMLPWTAATDHFGKKDPLALGWARPSICGVLRDSTHHLHWSCPVHDRRQPVASGPDGWSGPSPNPPGSAPIQRTEVAKEATNMWLCCPRWSPWCMKNYDACWALADGHGQG